MLSPYVHTNIQESYSNQEKQCAFIESIRYGTYDSYGEFYSSSSQSTTSSQEHVAVTGVQTFFIVTFGLICSGCAAYACFIHHQITNLLLRSLSLGLVDAQRSKSCERAGRSMSRNRRSGRSAIWIADNWNSLICSYFRIKNIYIIIWSLKSHLSHDSSADLINFMKKKIIKWYLFLFGKNNYVLQQQNFKR